MALQAPSSPFSFTGSVDNSSTIHNRPDICSSYPPPTISAAPPNPVFSGTPDTSSRRRSPSDGSFRVSHNDICLSPELFEFPTEMGSNDEFLPTFIDMHNSGRNENKCADRLTNKYNGGEDGGGGECKLEKSLRSRRRCSGLLEGVCSVKVANRAISPAKLAEIWADDPKRAKRILSNRQSAARSKQRKARYVAELEQKVQTLQSEAANLSAQLSFYQRDTVGLFSENAQLKMRLQAMEQQAQLRDALNEALKQEIERLKPAAFPSLSTQQPIQCSPSPSPSTMQTASYSAAVALPSISTVQSSPCSPVTSSCAPLPLQKVLCSHTAASSPPTTSLFPLPRISVLVPPPLHNSLSPRMSPFDVYLATSHKSGSHLLSKGGF
ncbi:hypothetical protein NMG60_11034336 [Bertholletia excelsa]